MRSIWEAPEHILFSAESGEVSLKAGPHQSVNLFREKLATVQPAGNFYYEWGTAVGNAGDQALSAWLDGISLSDADGLPRLDAERGKLSLAGLGVACKELYGTSGEKTFLRARGVVGQLGLRIPSIERDARTSGYFRRHRDEAEVEGIEAMSVDVAVQAIEDAVFLAYDLSSDRDDLVDEGVPYPDEMSFTSLRKFAWKKM